MEITLNRQPSFEETTLGTLFIDGAPYCATLEDVVRPDGEAKVDGRTAIPAGRYRVMVTFSNRFQRQMPLVCGVPGFEGIRIHPGNTAADTEGCILVGIVSDARTIINSRATFDGLFPRIVVGASSEEGCWIDVRDAVAAEPAGPEMET
jgi:hypothetical protein